MRQKQLKQIIKECLPELVCELDYSGDSYDTLRLRLPDGGYISVGIDPRNRQIKFDFLFFNIRESNLRLSGQDPYNGKFNYFGAEPVAVLRELLVELKEKI